MTLEIRKSDRISILKEMTIWFWRDKKEEKNNKNKSQDCVLLMTGGKCQREHRGRSGRVGGGVGARGGDVEGIRKGQEGDLNS